MSYAVKILADSVTGSGRRLTTFELTYPRFVHSEFMTHRHFSRNAASSRAIPIEKTIERVMTDPAMPVYWGKNQPGMVAETELTGHPRRQAEVHWLAARDAAVLEAQAMLEYGVHKQIANRLLEPWVWITVICSATNYENFFSLRCAPDAQPELRYLALWMRDTYYAATPEHLFHRDWHLPLVRDEDEQEFRLADCIRLSVARCARVSYLTHDGRRDPAQDFALYDRLRENGHMSPFEHAARPWFYHQIDPDAPHLRSNFDGWVQHRKTIEGECRNYSWPPI